MGEDLRCPLNSPHRVFKKGNKNNPFTLEQCRERCENHSQCKYFTFGTQDAEKKSRAGMCIGCSAEAESEFAEEIGMDTFKLCEGGFIAEEPKESPTDSPTLSAPASSPTRDDSCDLQLTGENIKCPAKNPKRLFKTKNNAPITLAVCKELCQENPDC